MLPGTHFTPPSVGSNSQNRLSHSVARESVQCLCPACWQLRWQDLKEVQRSESLRRISNASFRAIESATFHTDLVAIIRLRKARDCEFQELLFLSSLSSARSAGCSRIPRYPINSWISSKWYLRTSPFSNDLITSGQIYASRLIAGVLPNASAVSLIATTILCACGSFPLFESVDRASAQAHTSAY